MLRYADWNYWNQMPNAELWECVWLSLGYDPRDSSVSYAMNHKVDKGYRDLLPRLDIAKTHAELRMAPFLPIKPSSGHTAGWRFSIPVFIAWANRMQWPMPSEFKGFELPPELASSPSPVKQAAPAPTEKPMTDKERGNLHRIIAALVESAVDKTSSARKFRSEAKLIEHLADHYQGYGGISTSNLENVFSKSKQSLKE
ncbi:MAG: hypothetical protein JNN20_08325 [Betaproteobacteria bacterium]|nr:hypothetical protein [Betaproteobacteria bacterium]